MSCKLRIIINEIYVRRNKDVRRFYLLQSYKAVFWG